MEFDTIEIQVKYIYIYVRIVPTTFILFHSFLFSFLYQIAPYSIPSFINMKFLSAISFHAAALAGQAVAQTVSGAAEGFAKGVSGGGGASPVYPQTTQDLKSYLGDNEPRVIVLTKTCVIILVL